MNEVNKLIKKKSGQNILDFVSDNFKQDYYAYIASLVNGTIRIRDVKVILEKTGMDANEFFAAWEKSYKGPKIIQTTVKQRLNTPSKSEKNPFSI